MSPMTATAPMIRREIDADGICVLTFDRPESGANIFDPATKIGLPETTLGLVPAWGGATRLPRLIGADAAAEVILTGKLYGANETLKLGLVDEVVAKEQLLEAARKKLGEGKREATTMK